MAVISVASGVITALLPKNRLSGCINTLSAILIIYTFLLPASNYKTELFINIDDLDEKEISMIYKAPEDVLIELSEAELEKKIEKILSDINIVAESTVKFEHNKENNIIREIIIVNGYFNKNEKELITNVIEAELGRSVIIEFNE